MNKPLIIGITGGMGSGKTTIAKILREEGYFVYDSDAEAKRLQNENPVIRKELTEVFGENIYNSEGLDRKKLAGLVFGNPTLLNKLNLIVHPVVCEDFLNWKRNYSNERFIFIESAILFESKFNLLTDKVILITASENIRVERVAKRDGLNVDQVKLRIKNQLSDEEKIKYIDAVINTNEGPPTISEIRKKIYTFVN
jgi:dephospho-CoA kinase